MCRQVILETSRWQLEVTDATVPAAASRELFEETGLRVRESGLRHVACLLRGRHRKHVYFTTVCDSEKMDELGGREIITPEGDRFLIEVFDFVDVESGKVNLLPQHYNILFREMKIIQ